MGVECAWPPRDVGSANRRGVPRVAGRLRRKTWRAIALAVVVGLLSFGGWSLKEAAIDISTVVPSVVPTQSE